MSERDNAVKRVKDDGRINHLVVVQLSKIFDFGNTALVEFKVILLQTKSDCLEKVVNDQDYKVLVIAVKGPSQDRKEMDITILDFPGLRENLLKYTDDL